jgi:hypothetical protein
MSYISLLLRSVHDSVHTFSMNLNFNEPKIYTGGVDITKWSTLSKSSQKEALLKSWYIYFSFRDPETGKMKRQTNIKGDANRLKTKRDRFKLLQVYQRNLSLMLQNGFNPYEYNAEVESSFFGNKSDETKVETAKVKTKPKIKKKRVGLPSKFVTIFLKPLF